MTKHPLNHSMQHAKCKPIAEVGYKTTLCVKPWTDYG